MTVYITKAIAINNIFHCYKFIGVAIGTTLAE